MKKYYEPNKGEHIAKNTFWFELEEDSFFFFFLLSFKEQVNVNYIVGACCCSAG